MTRRSNRSRRVGRRNYVGERASTTKVQLLMACGVLAMLLALGPSLSQGAAGCFQAVSGDADETVSDERMGQPPQTTVRIDDVQEGRHGDSSAGIGPDVGANDVSDVEPSLKFDVTDRGVAP